MAFAGQERFVGLSDRTKMPYTEAVLREAMRMFPVLPLGFPRATSCDVDIGKFLNLPSTVPQFILNRNLLIAVLPNSMGPLSLTWFKFNPSMDK